MDYDLNKNIIGSCCNQIPDFIVRYNGAPSSDYSVLLCKLHLSKNPFDKNILFVKELKNIKNNIFEDESDE